MKQALGAQMEAKASQQHLAKVLSTSREVEVQERIAWALGKIGVSSEDEVMALKKASNGGDTRLALLAKSALSASQKEIEFDPKDMDISLWQRKNQQNQRPVGHFPRFSGCSLQQSREAASADMSIPNCLSLDPWSGTV